jgi:hypothetical protein
VANSMHCYISYPLDHILNEDNCIVKMVAVIDELLVEQKSLEDVAHKMGLTIMKSDIETRSTEEQPTTCYVLDFMAV